MSKIELREEQLQAVVGGSIDIYPDNYGAQTGKIGIDGNFTHRYYSESDVLDYYNAHKNDKEWTSIKERDEYIFAGLLESKLIY